jgi:DNA invertase Pin-like site-specific DNA recombinase
MRGLSTNAQDYERQLDELRAYADRMGYEVAREFSEKISGARKVEERAALTDLLDYVESNEVDKVLIYECSRLSRRAVDFLAVIEQLTEQGVSVYIHQNGLETLQPDGKPQPDCPTGAGCAGPVQLYGAFAHQEPYGERV